MTESLPVEVSAAVKTAEPEADEAPVEPVAVFFLSYARPAELPTVGQPADQHDVVHTLFTDLSRHVNELVAPMPGVDAGFMDTLMGGNERWESTLLRAAGTCQVFVALMSRRYLYQSRWCPREWDLFARRKIVGNPAPRSATGGPAHEVTAILPVLWTPLVDEIPQSAGTVQWFSPAGAPDPNFVRLYKTHGMYGLLAQPGLRDAYQSIVWMLALRIQRIHHDYHVQPEIRKDFTGLRESF